MKKTVVCLLLSSCCFAAVSVPVTVQEALYPGSVSGVSRTNEPVTVGVPLPDSASITSTSVLGLSGASAAQFSVEGRWPDGNIKWVKIRALVPSLAGGGTSTLTLTDSGTGNFGGANLATDNGSTITVSTNGGTCGSGSAICFTVKKANFNLFDQVQVGGTALVASGASRGLVVLGPNPTAAYPGNVTCSPTAGGTACTTVYSTANDAANSTCSIEENGPAMAVLKCDADLNDGAGHVYMHATVREYFSQGSAKVKLTTILRNADYGANSSNFATAYKGIQGFEARITPSLSGTLTYTIANDTAAPTTGTLNASGGTDSAYLYQAESALMKTSGWCNSGTGTRCVPYSTLSGYSIVHNGAAVLTGTNKQYPQGWADISDANGNGVEIGQYQLAAYGNKSLEFRGGGTDVRVGILAAENNTTSTGTTTANKPYYIPYPQYEINDIYFNFHVGAPASLANEFLKMQHYLLGRAAPSWYNTASAFFYPLLDPSEEDAFYNTVVSTASPSVSPYTFQDLGVTSSQFPLTAWRYYSWPSPGASNQMEFHESRILNFLRRGYTGGYLDTAQFYKLIMELGMARADGFSWTSKSSAETQYFNYPSVTLNNTNANAFLGMMDWIEIDQEHAHWYGMPDYYWVSGDETVKDFLTTAARDQYLNTISSNNLISSGRLWNSRATGTVLMSVARLHNFFQAIGDTSDASAILARGNTVWSLQVKPNLCASGYPAGCTPDVTGADAGANQRGTSAVRGVTYQWGETSFSNAGCASTPPSGVRTFVPFMAGILTQGMWELRQEEGSGWADYNSIFDTAYGITQAMFGEMYVDNGTNSWTGNGLRYKSAIDYASACGSDFAVQNPDAYWPAYYLQYQYLGQGTANWYNRLVRDVQSVYGVCAGACMDEMYQYTIANLIYVHNHGGSLTLATVPISGFADNGGGAYTISWTVPSGAQSYRVKWGPAKIVDYIGYNAGTGAFIGNPAATQNWFASQDASGVPAPGAAGTTQSLTINTGVSGLTSANFMVKAYASGTAALGDTMAPAVSMSAPAGGTTASGTVTVSATASDNVGVASVQFRLDGANLGSALSGSGPSYSMSWDTTKAANGSHTLAAVAADAAGNTTTSAAVTLTVNNTSAAPVISSVTASGITTNGATINWTTDVASDSQVAYGTTASYTSTTPLVAALVTAHSVSISGLTAATTYHFQVISKNQQGTASRSADFTFTTQPATTSGGTAIPTGTWTQIPSTGWPAEILNYDKSEYVASRRLHCVYGAYKQYLSSEHNNALVCYSYSENRWTVLDNNGYWHSSHSPGVGHTVSVWSYINDKDSIAFQADGSGSNSPESFVGFWWWYDIGGLSGQNRTFSPRPWLGVQTPLVEMMTYDQYDKKLILYDQAGAIEVCDPSSNSCAKPAISGTAPPSTLTSPNMVYNSSDHKMYIYGGGSQDIYTVACSTSACTSMTGALLSVTCTGADCANGRPPVRLAAGMAYSTKDNVFMMVGGIPSYASSSWYNDTWLFDPARLSWTELSPASTYSANRTYFTADRLTYDPDSNVFVLMSINGYTPVIYAYPYSNALNYGRTAVVYTPPMGSLNRVAPTAASQSWVFDPAIAASGSTVYLGWIETGSNGDNSTCGQTHHPYIQSTNGSSTWAFYPGGTQAQACLGIDPDLSGSTNDSKLRLAAVGGTLWESHEKINHNQGYYSNAFASRWTGTAWSGGAVGCFFAACGEKLRQNPQALIGVGSTPTVAVIEWNRLTYTPEGYVYVAQWNGSAWTALGAKLNINGTGTQALEAALATDGSNPAACWSEQVVAGDRRTVTTTPQIQCAQWNGSAWARFGSSSLNQSASSWANDPSMTYMGGKYYVAWVERATAGTSKVYACRWDGTICTLLGGGPLNVSPATGWAAHPSLANDGTNVYIAWEEQAAQGQHSLGYVKRWDGTAWTQVGGSLNADVVNGSVSGISMTLLGNAPVAIWGELTYGNLRQAYAKIWNGSNWTGVGGVDMGVPPQVSCDVNGDGVVNSTDVQLATAQALGTAPCGTADLRQNGRCDVVDVQRVVNASLGGACVIGP